MKRATAIGSTALALLALALVLTACGPSKAQQEQARLEAARKEAVSSAQTKFAELRTGRLTGDQAAAKARSLYDTLDKVHLYPDAIGIQDPKELDSIVKEAYAGDVHMDLRSLQDTHANVEGAKVVKAAIERSVNLSGKTLADFNTSEARLNQSVARNALEMAAEQPGVRITPAMYRAAGLPPNAVIKRVPVRVLVPAKQPARAAAKPRPAPRPAPKRR